MDEISTSISKIESQTTKGMELLAFKLGQEEYGVAIQNVQELRCYGNVTHLANAPDFIKGIVNLRGVIVPIVDMRIKFNLGGTPTYDQFTVVVVLNIKNQIIGMVVDSVSDVFTVTEEQIKPPPQIGSVIDTDYLIGLGTVDDRMVILVAIDRLMAGNGMGLIAKLAA